MAIELTADEEEALTGALTRLDSSSAAESPESAGISPIDLFCRNWPTLKAVLLFLRNLPGMPDRIKTAIDLVIKVGNFTSGKICKT